MDQSIADDLIAIANDLRRMGESTTDHNFPRRKDLMALAARLAAALRLADRPQEPEPESELDRPENDPAHEHCCHEVDEIE